MFGGSGPSPAQLAELRLQTRRTLQQFVVGVAVLHSGGYDMYLRRHAKAFTDHSSL